MKKLKKLFLLALTCIMACCCLLFSGCSAKGIYKFSSLKYDDGETSLTINTGDKFEGIVFDEESIILEINKDNTFYLRVNCIKNADVTGEEIYFTTNAGTWMDGYQDEIYFFSTDDEGEGLIGIQKGKTITLTIPTEGIELVLKK